MQNLRFLNGLSSRLPAVVAAVCLLALPLRAQTLLFGNLGGTTGTVTLSDGFPIYYYTATIDYWGAVGFTVGSTGYQFDHATAPFGSLYSPTGTIVEGGLYSDASGNPGSLLAAFNTVHVAGDAYPVTTYDLTLASGTLEFQPNTTYWLVVHDAAPGPLWGRTGAATDPVSSVGFTFAGYRGSENGGGVWDNSGYYGISGIKPSIDIYAAPAIPEPATYAAMAGVAALGAVVLKRRRRSTGGAVSAD